MRSQNGDNFRRALANGELAQPLHILIPGLGDVKNTAAQILAACVLPNVVVHLIDTPATAYLRACPAPVVVHGRLAAAPFAALLARVDVVMYVSLSECSPGVVLESAAAGKNSEMIRMPVGSALKGTTMPPSNKSTR